MWIVLPVTDRPNDLAGVSNGRIPRSLTVIVHPDGRDAAADTDRLHHLTARKWAALVHYAAELGIPLSYTGCGRTYNAQVAMFLSRYTAETQPNVRPAGCKPGSRKSWDGTGWWLNNGADMAAVPGTSNHGWGQAIDMSYGWYRKTGAQWRSYVRSLSTAEARALTEPVLACGFSWEAQSELWHIRDVTGDTIPEAVLRFEQPAPLPQPVEGEETVKRIRWNDPTDPTGRTYVGLIYDGITLKHVGNGNADLANKALFGDEIVWGNDFTPVEWLEGIILDSVVVDFTGGVVFNEAKLDAAWTLRTGVAR